MNEPVKFELAKLLKEKGFDKECHSYYVPEVHQKVCYQEYGGEKFDMNKIHTAYGKECFSAPTIAEVVIWLYEKYGIWINAMMIFKEFTPYIQCDWNYKQDAIKEVLEFMEKRFNSPTEAYEAAIEYTLKSLI